MKTDLGTRPVFHWKPRRIHAPFCLCFVAFALVRLLHYRYHLPFRQYPISPSKIRHEGRGVEVSLVEDTSNHNQFLCATDPTQTQKNIDTAID
ncbi:MAG: hypothetical protein OXC92_04230 [Flavobacteriaceae bacterium]|nr:hypothetical protein [Flavobacteriaceae bacterium]MCY4216176.1 hypothetical protein [Flavobacteriaceae bacterium]MCY4267672.1 hypothetical protein [Flavobacteriaceae bacterium]